MLDPCVIERALSKFEARITAPPDTTRTAALESERQQLQLELSRLTAALAAGGSLAALVEAVRDREERLNRIAAEVGRQRADLASLNLSLAAVMPEVRRRMDDWQAVLAAESTEARQMLRTLLKKRLVFTPDLEGRARDYAGEGDMSEVFRGLVNVPKALASPAGFEPAFWP